MVKDIKLITFLFLAWFYTHNALADDNKENVAQFKEAYAKYQDLALAGQWKESLVYAKEAYIVGGLVYGKNSKDRAALAQNYGNNLYDVGRKKEAETILKISLSINEQLHGKTASQLIPVLQSLGQASSVHKSASIQEKYFKRMLKIANDTYGIDSSQYGMLQVSVGRSLYQSAHLGKAKKYLYSGYETLLAILGESSPKTGLAAFNIGKIEMSYRDYDDAIGYLNKALLGFEAGDNMSRNEFTTHAFLINAYENIGESELATEHCIAIGRAKPMTDVQDYVPIFKKSPKYPRTALNAGVTGDVIVEFDVDKNGFVTEPRMVSFTGHKAFVKSALKAAESFRYAPAFVDGKAVLTKGVRNRIIYEIAR